MELRWPNPGFVVKLALAFGASLGLWYLVRYPYSRLVSFLGAYVLSWFSGTPPESLVFVKDGTFYLDTQISLESGRHLVKALPVYPVSWNGIFFLTPLLLAPWIRLRQSWRYLLTAALILAASHVLYFTVATLFQVAALHEAAGFRIMSPVWRELLAVTTQCYSLTLANLLPFLLVAPVFLRRM